LFQRHLGWQHRVTLRSLRFWLFVTAGVVESSSGQNDDQTGRAETSMRLVAGSMEKILSPFPNCNAAENQPAFTNTFS